MSRQEVRYDGHKDRIWSFSHNQGGKVQNGQKEQHGHSQEQKCTMCLRAAGAQVQVKFPS